jgi:hypothetical protein
MFAGDQDAEFYHGLLVGYANAVVISENLEKPSAVNTLKKLVAFIADRIAKMEA